MYPFEFLAPTTLDDALGALHEHGDEAKVLAGGQSLIPILHYRLAQPRALIDVNGLPLGAIALDGHRITAGALVRHHELEESETVARHCPVLAEAVPPVRNLRV